MRYAIRGSRQARTFEGAILQATLSGLTALINGKRRPLLHAAAGLVAGAEAQGHHRLVDRARLSERHAKTAEQVADAASRLLDQVNAARVQPSRAQLPSPTESPALHLVREAWDAVTSSTGRPPGELHVPRWIHSLLTDAEREKLQSVCLTRSVLLVIAATGASVRAIPRPPQA